MMISNYYLNIYQAKANDFSINSKRVTPICSNDYKPVLNLSLSYKVIYFLRLNPNEKLVNSRF